MTENITRKTPMFKEEEIVRIDHNKITYLDGINLFSNDQYAMITDISIPSNGEAYRYQLSSLVTKDCLGWFKQAYLLKSPEYVNEAYQEFRLLEEQILEEKIRMFRIKRI